MLTITDEGAKRVNNFLESRGSGVGIRVKVTTTGCSGFAYGIEFADETNSDDTIFEDKGIKIIVDPKSLIMIDGTELDYKKQKGPEEDQGPAEEGTIAKNHQPGYGYGGGHHA